jgi:hypothetical protein
LYWRRVKIADFKAKWMFKQEYPNNIMEAFQTSGESLYLQRDIMMARKETARDQEAPLVIGVDPAITRDRFVVVFRRGRQLIRYVVRPHVELMQQVGYLAEVIKKENPVKMFIDVGCGYGIISRLRELGFGSIIVGVHFGEGATRADIFANKRAEMLVAIRDWFDEGGVNLPDDDALMADLLSIPIFKHTSTGKFIFPSKSEIRAKYGASSDIVDALGLTFALPVNRLLIREGAIKRVTGSPVRGRKRPGALSTLSRVRNRNSRGL